MKVVHVYAKNLKVFEEALTDTGCHVNGSVNLRYMMKSLTQFNARDVMGLIVFKSPMTRKTLQLVKKFDDLFVFSPLPVVIISDQATALYRSGKIRVRNSKLFLVDSIDNTISDIDLRRIFTTLSCLSGSTYDLSEVESRYERISQEQDISPVESSLEFVNVLLTDIAKLGGQCT